MFDRRKILFIAAVVLLVIVLSLLWWRLFTNKSPEATTDQANTSSSDEIKKQAETLAAPAADRLIQEKNYPLGLKSLAFSFAERYGTYSTDAAFENLRDLMPLMTEKMKLSTEKTIAAGQDSPSFESFDTKALSSDLLSFGDEAAQVAVKVQRMRVTESSSEPEVSYQTLSMKFIKSGDEWLVDEAAWR